jgi:hypothetical protein
MTDAHDPVVTDEILEDRLQAVQRSVDQPPATPDDVTAFARIPAATAEAALRELQAAACWMRPRSSGPSDEGGGKRPPSSADTVSLSGC